MCAENLGRALGQTLAEMLELMNAVRSQCVAQQLQLNNTHTHAHTSTPLKKKITGKRQG